MPAAGDIITLPVPGQMVGTPSIRTGSSGTFTAETEVQTVTVGLISGKVYRVVYKGTLQSSVGGDSARSRIREDNVTGTQLQNYRVPLQNAAAGFTADVEAEYTAVATADKTFSVTGERASGTGNISASASATGPAYLYVEFIR